MLSVVFRRYRRAMGEPQQQIDVDAFMAVFIPFFIIGMALAILQIIMMWLIFEKAGKPGWAAIVPFYNTYVLLKLVGRPGWWMLLFFLPIVNIVFLIMVMVDLATAFGKPGVFAVLLIFLQPIGMAILAFSKNAVYRGPLADAHFMNWQQQQPGQYPPIQ
jgi:Family of unknown function (DUF5684)